ncbi:MAG: hypothetical protein A2Y23_06175 [Clostridiales bacterium GWB2_37_7]|nr:MAG: hypothetical protein A2Y23_06175 [Clostridiales bacterium GWB2_37_7]
MFFEDELLNRRKVITEDESFIKFEISLNELIGFIWSLSDLISWNGHVIASFIGGKKFILQTELIDSAVKTLCSIRMCCQYGNISDANTLIRKYRDDMFLLLYFIEVSNNYSILNEKTTEHEENAVKWIENRLNDLHISTILKYLATNKIVAEVIKKHNLRNVWDAIGTNLNNYVHNNGMYYTLLNYGNFDKKGIDSFTKDTLFKLEYITVVFMVILILIEAPFISSSDYIDALTVGIEPEDGSQYNIAPFIQEFINKNIKKVNPELKKFLVDNVYMRFE